MEIGGYFGLDELIHKEYYPNLIALNTARNALAYLIKTKDIRKLFIPTYLCDSVFKVCEREGCAYEFYDVDEAFQPIFGKMLQDNEWLYIVNFYGQVTNERELKQKYDRIIFDNVQAFFQRPVEGIDTIYSCRKFFGVPDGAYLATDAELDLETDISVERMKHILGRYELSASEFYQDYAKNEELFYKLPIKRMSQLTHNILGAIDYEKIISVRENNFRFLYEMLYKKNKIKIRNARGPFAYPFYMSNGMVVKKRLAQKGIYIATLWPNAIEHGGIAKEYSENILPLPCDQRYTLDDMAIIVDELKKEMEPHQKSE